MSLLSFQNGLILTVCGVIVTNVVLLLMRKELNDGRTQDERIPLFSVGIGGWSRILSDYRSSGKSNVLALVLKAGIAVTFLGFACAALSSNATPAK